MCQSICNLFVTGSCFKRQTAHLLVHTKFILLKNVSGNTSPHADWLNTGLHAVRTSTWQLYHIHADTVCHIALLTNLSSYLNRFCYCSIIFNFTFTLKDSNVEVKEGHWFLSRLTEWCNTARVYLCQYTDCAISVLKLLTHFVYPVFSFKRPAWNTKCARVVHSVYKT